MSGHMTKPLPFWHKEPPTQGPSVWKALTNSFPQRYTFFSKLNVFPESSSLRPLEKMIATLSFCDIKAPGKLLSSKQRPYSKKILQVVGLFYKEHKTFTHTGALLPGGQNITNTSIPTASSHAARSEALENNELWCLPLLTKPVPYQLPPESRHIMHLRVSETLTGALQDQGEGPHQMYCGRALLVIGVQFDTCSRCTCCLDGSLTLSLMCMQEQARDLPVTGHLF